MGKYIASSENVKLLGRTYLRDEILWCAFSATGVEFVSRSKEVYITVYGDSAYSDEANRARYAVYVDGVQTEVSMLDEAERRIKLVADSEETVHIIRFIKLSESAMSTLGIGAIEADNIIPTSDKEFFVEYIGDSITCGYGADDEDPLHNFKTSTENVSKAFSYVSADLLNVDYSLVSFSGYGVVSGYTGDGVINTKELLPQHYGKLGFSYATSGVGDDTFKVEDIPWDFSGRKPEIVVINLGTNDMSYTGDDKIKQKNYQEKYIELVKMVRNKYPDCYILSILGLMGDLLYPVLAEAVNEYKVETGDVRIETMPLKPIDAETEGYVADYHPTKVSHRRAAEAVAERVSNIVYREYGQKIGGKQVALTFDDGPNTSTTVEVLDVLEQENVPGTFFLVGNSVDSGSSASVRRAVSQGCEIENHSVTHSVMSDMSEEEFLAEIEEVNEIVNKLTGKYPTFFRPPYIAVNDLMKEKIPMSLIAGYGCDDWDDEITINMRIQRILAQLGDGRLFLLHDKDGNTKTVTALKTIIKTAKAMGYTFVRLDELFEQRCVVPKNGILYNEAKN